MPKLDEIKYDISNMNHKVKPDILGMCETFLNTDKCIPNYGKLDLPVYSYDRKDQVAKMGGGWIAYFHKSVKHERQSEIGSENVESMWFEVFPKHQKLFLLCFIYRPPNSDVLWYKLT